MVLGVEDFMLPSPPSPASSLGDPTSPSSFDVFNASPPAVDSQTDVLLSPPLSPPPSMEITPSPTPITQQLPLSPTPHELSPPEFKPNCLLSPGQALGYVLKSKTSFKDYQKLSDYTAHLMLTDSRTRKNRFAFRVFPATHLLLEVFEDAVKDMSWHSTPPTEELPFPPNQTEHVSLQFVPLLRQMVSALVNQKLLNCKDVRERGLRVRWSFDGIRVCDGKFYIVSTITILNLRRLVLSRSQHQLIAITKVGDENLKVFQQHLEEKLREEIERNSKVSFPEIGDGIEISVYYCLDLSAAVKSTGLRTCKEDCPFCTLNSKEWGNFQAQLVMRDLSGNHAFPKGTSIWHILPDVLHMKIRLVTNLLLRYINAIKTLNDEELEKKMWHLLEAIHVAHSESETKKVKICMNGPVANSTLQAFCDRTELLDLLIDPSVRATIDFRGSCSEYDFEGAFQRRQRQTHHQFGELWLNLRAMLSFLANSGLDKDLDDVQIETFQKRALQWGEMFLCVNTTFSVPTYVHVLVCHVPAYLKYHRQLGLFSQQPAESKYSELKDDWAQLTHHRKYSMVLLLERQWVCDCSCS